MKKTIAGLALGLGSAALVLLLGRLGWMEAAELKTYDWRMRRVANPASVSRDIVLVEINDTTVRNLAPFYGRWPWPRVVFSSLIDYLSRAPAKVIAVDFTFPEEQRNVTFKIGGTDGQTWTGEESDNALVESVRNANVILLADAVYAGTIGAPSQTTSAWRSPYRLGPSIEERPIIVPPFAALTGAARALAHNFLPIDRDGLGRRMPPFVRVGDRYLPALGVAAALIAGGFGPNEVTMDRNDIRVRDRVIPLVSNTVPDALDSTKTHEQRTMLINYRAPAFLPDGSRPFKSYEARNLIVSEDQLLLGERPFVDPAEFKDKIVFVGQTLSGLVDVFQTPYGSTIPGIQLHASIADSILSGRFLRPASFAHSAAVTLTAATLVGLMSALLPFTAAGLGTLLAGAGYTWYSVHQFRGGLWIALAQPLLGMAVALFAGTAYRYFVEDREKRRVKGLFGRYVSKDVYDQLINNPGLAQLGGKRREMSVLFSDIRGFTSVTERGDPEELVSQLNEYFSRMVEVVFRHHGTVDKFVGDMVMALFGAPLDDPDHAEHAVAAAVDMVRELGLLNQRWASEHRAQLDVGVGINSGDMIAGNIGSSSIMSYTVIGDNVNLGARLESLNKEYKTRIIISDATRVRLNTHYEMRPLGDVIVKGKTRPVAIFEISVPSPLLRTSEEATI